MSSSISQIIHRNGKLHYVLGKT